MNCPECDAEMNEVSVYGTDKQGNDFDYEAFACPNRCNALYE